MRVVLNGWQIKSEPDFHREIAEQLKFSAYYGRNLDALWDTMTTDVERPLLLVWEHSAASKQALGATFQTIVDVLNDSAQQDEQFGRKERLVIELA